jgi:hypothetical protein
MQLDIADDFFLMDFLSAATLQVAGSDDVLLPKVLSEPASWRELDPTKGIVTRAGTLFVWPKTYSSRPPLGAKIIDENSIEWTILRLMDKQHVETWEATCVALAVEAGLDNVATVLRANSYNKNDSGEAVPVWTEIASGIPARWQPLMEEAEIFEDASFPKETYRVTFGASPINEPKELANECYRIVDSQGYRYRVMRYETEERIDRLPVAIAVKILEGDEFYDYAGSGV